MSSVPFIPSLEFSSPISQSTNAALAAVMPADFDKQSYWHKRFTTEESFEWLLPSDHFMTLIEPVLESLDPNSSRLLQLGFGTSDLHNHFRSRGFSNLLNVDYEPLAVSRGRDLEMQAFGNVKMSYDVQDATQLSLGKKFDLIFDKSTVDAISCAGETAFRRLVAGVRRHLADRAVWVSLSYSATRFHLDDLPFDVQVLAQVPTPKLSPHDPDVYHWCYLLRPKRDTPQDSPELTDAENEASVG